MNAPTPTASMGLVIFAKNPSTVSAFYQQTLGLALIDADSSHHLLAGAGLELVIHAIPPAYAAEIEISQPPQLREDTPLKPAFWVADLAAVRVATEATGGGLNPASKTWQIRGAAVLDGWDPEGNVVQFKQRS
ncbi:hypothetical protein [Ideonella sp.]|jgi:hypothetical protein|uniref:hypothetical protein n=1 Tax=Ideonella sp. TaxID=1929293 RepID=UPI0037BFAD54